ncbi:MAG: hypothetical protein LBO80_12010 [Treponema sp.]|jgi:hypothetical protein|nr:hypothetical protein [Treponema sp.]
MAKHVIAPDREQDGLLEGAVKIQRILSRFDVQKSVERMRSRVSRWKDLSVGIIRELYFVREYLNGQQGQHRDPGADDYIAYTWGDYCAAIGLSRQSANGWLRRFTPAELSESGEDKLLAPEELKALAPPELPPTTREQERNIARYMATGVRPEGWSKIEEKIVRERLEAKRTREFTDLWMEGKFKREPRRDYFNEIRAVAGTGKRFRLKTQAQIDAQTVMFRAIHDYLGLFQDMEGLMGAAANLNGKIHTAANYFAELLAERDGA